MALNIQYTHPETWNANYDNNHNMITKTYIDSESVDLFTVQYSYNNGLLVSASSTENMMDYRCYHDSDNNLIKQSITSYYDANNKSFSSKDDMNIAKPFFPSLMNEFDVIYDDDGQPFYLDPYHTRILPIGNSKFYDETKTNVLFTTSILNYDGDNINLNDKTGYIFKNGKIYISVSKTDTKYYSDTDDYVNYVLDYNGNIVKQEMSYDTENKTATLTEYTFTSNIISKDDISLCMVDIFNGNDSIKQISDPYVSLIEKYEYIFDKYRRTETKSYNSDGSVDWENSYKCTYDLSKPSKCPTYKTISYDTSGNEINYDGLFKTFDSNGRCIESRYYDIGDLVWDDQGTYTVTYTDNDDGSYIANKIYYNGNGTAGIYLTNISSLPKSSTYYMESDNINVFSTNTRSVLQSMSSSTSNAISNELITDVLKIPNIPFNNECKYNKDGDIMYIHVFKNNKNELEYRACVDIERDDNGRISKIKYYNEDGTINSKISRSYVYNEDGTIKNKYFISDDGIFWTGSYEYVYNLDNIEGFNGYKRYMYDNKHYIFNISQANYTSESIIKKRYYYIDGSICWTISYDIENGETYRFDPEGNRFRFDVTKDGFIIGDESVTTLVNELQYNSSTLVNDKNIKNISSKYGFDYYYNKVIAKLNNGRQVCETYSAYTNHIFIKHVMNNKVDVCICCGGNSEQFNIENIFVNFYDSHDIKYMNLIYNNNMKLSTNIPSNITASLKYDDDGNILERMLLNSTNLSNLCNVTYTYYDDVNYNSYPSYTKEYNNSKLIDCKIYGNCTIYDLKYYSSNKCIKYTYNEENLIEERRYRDSSSCIFDPENVDTFGNITKYTYENGLLKTSRYYDTDDSGDPIWTDSKTCDYYYSDGKLDKIVRFNSETDSYTHKTYEYIDDKIKITENSTGNYTLKYNNGDNDVEEYYIKYTNSSTDTEDFYKSYEIKYLNGVKISQTDYNIDSSTGITYISYINEYMSDGSGRQTRYVGYSNKGVLSNESIKYLGDEYKYTSYNSDGSISQYIEKFKENTTSTKIGKSSYVNGIPTNETYMDYPWGKMNSISRNSNGDILNSYIYTYNEDGELVTYTNVYYSSYDGTGYELINDYDPYYHKSYYQVSYKKYKSMTEVDWTDSGTKTTQIYYFLRKNGDLWTYENKVTKYKEDGTPYVYKVNELEYNEDEDRMDSISLKYYDEDGNFVPVSSEGSSSERYLRPDGSYIWKYYRKLSDGSFGMQWTIDEVGNINKYGYVEKRNVSYSEDSDGYVTKTINWYNSNDTKYDENDRIISYRPYNSNGEINWSSAYDQKYDKFGNIIHKKIYNSDGSIDYKNMKDTEYLGYNIPSKMYQFNSDGSISNETIYEYDIVDGDYIEASTCYIKDGKKVYSENSSSTIKTTAKVKEDLELSYINLYTISVYDADNSKNNIFGFSSSNPYTIQHDNTTIIIYFLTSKSSNRWYSNEMIFRYTDINGDKVEINYCTTGTNQTFKSMQITRSSLTGITSRYYSEDKNTINWTHKKTYDIIINDNGLESEYRYKSENDKYCYEGINITKKSDTLLEQRYYHNGTIQWGIQDTCDIYTTVDGKELYRIILNHQ